MSGGEPARGLSSRLRGRCDLDGGAPGALGPVPVVLIEPREPVQIEDRCRELLIEPAARVGRSRAGGGFREVLRRELATTEVAGQRTGRGATHEAHLRILARAGDRAARET